MLGLLLGLLGQAAPALEVAVATPSLIPLVAAIVGKEGQVRSLLPEGSSAHHATLRPSALAIIDRADLVVWLGADAEPALARRLQGASGVITVLDLPEVRPLAPRGLAGQPLSGRDPHVWLSPLRMERLATVLADRLTQLEPRSALSFQASLRRFHEALAGRREALRARFARLHAPGYAAWHDGYQYLEQEWGLKFAGAFVREPEAGAGLKALLQRQREWQKAPPSCVLLEPGMKTALPARLLPAARVLPLDETLLSYGDNYPDALTGLADDLLWCLGALPERARRSGTLSGNEHHDH